MTRKFKVRITLPGETRGFLSDAFGVDEADCLRKLRDRFGPGATIEVLQQIRILGWKAISLPSNWPTLEELRELDTAPESLVLTRARAAYQESRQ